MILSKQGISLQKEDHSSHQSLSSILVSYHSSQKSQQQINHSNRKSISKQFITLLTLLVIFCNIALIQGTRLSSRIQQQSQTLINQSQNQESNQIEAQNSIINQNQQCIDEISTIFNHDDVQYKPTEVLLNYEATFCHQRSDQFQKAVIPYFCFYTGLNLLNRLSISKTQQFDISNFCEHFGNGYQERKRFLSKLQFETNQSSFINKCVSSYENSYNTAVSSYDPLDMSGLLDTQYYCQSLYQMIQVLKPHHRDQLPDLLKYSYILSLQTFVETKEATDYGSCEEQKAKLDTFCLGFFDWQPSFSLWNQHQSQQICGKILTYANELQTQNKPIRDMCAFVITRVYGMYDQFMNKILDSILNREYDILNTELNAAIREQNQHETESKQNLEKVSKWLDDLKVKFDEEQKQENRAKLEERLKEVQQEKVKNEKALEKVMKFLDNMQSEQEKKQMKENKQQIKKTIDQLRKEEDNIIMQISPEDYDKVNQMLDRFILHYSQEKYEDALKDIQETIIFKEKYQKVSDFLETLLDMQQNFTEYDSITTQSYNQTDKKSNQNQKIKDKKQDKNIKQHKEKTEQNDKQSVIEKGNSSRFTYQDVQKVSDFLDRVIERMSDPTYQKKLQKQKTQTEIDQDDNTSSDDIKNEEIDQKSDDNINIDEKENDNDDTTIDQEDPSDDNLDIIQDDFTDEQDLVDDNTSISPKNNTQDQNQDNEDSDRKNKIDQVNKFLDHLSNIDTSKTSEKSKKQQESKQSSKNDTKKQKSSKNSENIIKSQVNDEAKVQENTLKVLKFLDNLLINHQTQIAKDKVLKFLDKLYENYNLKRDEIIEENKVNKGEQDQKSIKNQDIDNNQKVNNKEENKKSIKTQDNLDDNKQVIKTIDNKDANTNLTKDQEISKLIKTNDNSNKKKENSEQKNQNKQKDYQNKISNGDLTDKEKKEIDEKLDKIQNFIDTLLSQEQFNEKLEKVQQFIDHLEKNHQNKQQGKKNNEDNNDEDQNDQEDLEEQIDSQEENIDDIEDNTEQLSINNKNDEEDEDDVNRDQNQAINTNQQKNDGQSNDEIERLRKQRLDRDLYKVIQFLKNLQDKDQFDTQLQKVNDFVDGLIAKENLKKNENNHNQSTEDSSEINSLINSHQSQDENQDIDEDISETTDNISQNLKEDFSKVSDIDDLKEFLEEQLDSSKIEDEDKLKLQQLITILDKYELSERTVKVEQFIDNLLKKQRSKQLDEIKLQVQDVQDMLYKYSLNLSQRKKLSQSKSKSQGFLKNDEDSLDNDYEIRDKISTQKDSKYSSLLLDFDSIKNK